MPDTQLTTKFEVTLTNLRREGACFNGYNKLVRALQGREFTGDDNERESYINFAHADPIALTAILQSNGLEDALWALRCVPGVARDARLFVVWCARQVEYLMKDRRSKAALDVAERFANGEATAEELVAAWTAARDATKVSAWVAAWIAAWDAARGGTRAAAMVAAWAAAWDATKVAAPVAAWVAVWDAASGRTWATGRATARAAAWDAQKEMFIAMCEGRAPWQQAT